MTWHGQSLLAGTCLKDLRKYTICRPVPATDYHLGNLANQKTYLQCDHIPFRLHPGKYQHLSPCGDLRTHLHVVATFWFVCICLISLQRTEVCWYRNYLALQIQMVSVTWACGICAGCLRGQQRSWNMKRQCTGRRRKRSARWDLILYYKVLL